jgi:hypothetical protein
VNARWSALNLAAMALLGCADKGAAESAPSSPASASTPRMPMARIAGTYLRGGQGMFSDSLVLTSDDHFVRNFSGDDGGAQYDGRAEWVGDVLWLPRPSGIGTAGVFNVESESSYRVIAWGERLYLIEDLEMLRFCNAVNAGGEPRSVQYSYFFLRDGDWLKPAPGLPDLPEPWPEMLLHSDIEGRITALGYDGTAWLDLGTNDGLRLGMLLILQDVPMFQQTIDMGGPPTYDMPLELVTIETDRSLVRLQYPNGRPPIAVDMRVTSRAVDR